MTKSSVLRFSRYGVFQERSIYRRKIREKRAVFIERKSIANSEKAGKCRAFEAMLFLAYESSFVVNGGAVRTIRTNLKFSLHSAPSLQAAAATQRERRSGSA